MSRRLSPISGVAGKAPSPKLPISPHEGEMSGRTERGPRTSVQGKPRATQITFSSLNALPSATRS
ncbi:MAG: hypothetical protein E5V99_25575 [Mesorhizobium sp.]|nr:MAG: hypothetical protein E5V99_25575 [Mesorhizobium sp.]